MKKHLVVKKITDTGVVAVVRAANADQAKRITEACLAGGVNAIEMTFTVPGAHRVMEELAATYSEDEIILGAGTVLDPETARIAILSGARYVVTPGLNLEAIKLCNRYQIPIMPGAVTVRDAVEAMEAGADIIKVFPGELFGPKIIKALRGPLPHINLMPTGGVDANNVGEWIKAGAVAVGAGGALTGPAATGDYAGITARAKDLIEKVKQARA
ncbi:MAG: bifunctional 2-keto-4-hydroxyglutarate aldolase/2-keto-3-deoxy-6-phosphogluconate aldolase [Sporomusaceae bacterium]|nr:bifunctional 2-keto-4-hydroxyglutarate aldolase/2-keto-3-deoxy-6-phosphogluconate aldolase [Sporomusaceae bacterium]